MQAIKKARMFIETDPTDPSAQFIAELVLALQSEASFSVAKLYKLDTKQFDMVLEILDEWRLDRHYASKLRLIDTSMQLKSIG